MGLSDLPHAKWSSANEKEPILKSDFVDIEEAIFEVGSRPLKLTRLGAASVGVSAATDSPASVLLKGFPNTLHPGQFIGGGYTDNGLRINTAAASLDFASGDLWGNEKSSQWYAVYARAGDADSDFELKAMPYLRVKSQADTAITLGTNLDANTAIDYGWADIAGSIYVVWSATAASIGAVRTIGSINGTTVTYSGAALTLSQGDWFIILPDDNFRWLGDVWNNSSGDIPDFVQAAADIWWVATGGITVNTNWNSYAEDPRVAPPMGLPILFVEPPVVGAVAATPYIPIYLGASASLKIPCGGGTAVSVDAFLAQVGFPGGPLKMPVVIPAKYGTYGAATLSGVVVKSLGYGYAMEMFL